MFETDCLYADLALPGELRERDTLARERFGIPAAVLMENAARVALEEIRRRLPLRATSRILVFMGKGNNGGDGAALARILSGTGAASGAGAEGQVLVVATTTLELLPEPAATHCAAAKKVGVPFICAADDAVPPLPQEWLCPDLVVDAISGSGLKGELRPRELAFVRAVNSFRERSFIAALDIPSGLCGHRGRPRPEAVRAHLSIAFEAAALGLRLFGADTYSGELAVRDIGIPKAARAGDPACRLLSPYPGAHFLPAKDLHKGRAGKVLIVGGSGDMPGAPVLAALGALRAGAGIVHLALPVGARARIAPAFPEFISHTLGGGEDFSATDARALPELLRALRPDSLVLGPGAGRKEGVRALLAALLAEESRPPTVFDADALYFMGTDLAGLKSRDVLTPHPGEAARLLPDTFFGNKMKPTMREKARLVQEDRVEALAALVALTPACVVLKGAHTLIRQRGGPLTLAPFAEPALAAGGSGDVLAGAVGALLAHGLPAPEAAALGVHLHGRAGELLAGKSPCGHKASEIADAIPLARMELCAG
ncbi:MAG: NAD(P)H-hydrate dehydratase [Desulfovibrio sp.]|nr:NAD(P)H-hydrate dehydratase [Desulfovibrio sp.]